MEVAEVKRKSRGCVITLKKKNKKKTLVMIQLTL